jgi:sulfur carrier protein
MNTSEVIAISLDNRPHAVAAGTTLALLVESLGHDPRKVSTAVNGLFVPRGRRADCVLQVDDAVLLFQPIVGG